MLFYLLLVAGRVTSLFTRKVESALCFGTLKLDLPVRYLHIQLRHDNLNITESAGPLKTSVLGTCRYRSQLIDNYDGSYVFRIRLWSSCSRIILNIHTAEGVPLCNSPIILEKADGRLLYSEYCDCPDKNILEWMEEAGCSTEHQQLDSDLSKWSRIDFKKVLSTVKLKWVSPQQHYSVALCHYQIIDNDLYRQCYGEYTGFRMFVDAIFTSLMRKMYLPNTEFVFNLGDWPLVKTGGDPIPIISWCGSKDTVDIVLPTYELLKSVIDSMESVTLDIHSAKGQKNYRWHEKKDTAVFRGRDSCQLRLEVAELSRLYPDVLDAGITQYFFFNQSQHTPIVETMSFPEFFQHKFILSIDGTVAAYRFPFLLAGDSIIFKSESDFYEHYYADLEEGLHYFHFTSANLIEQIERARRQDYNKTLTAMREFVLNHLQPLNIYCLHADFIQKYTSKLEQMPQNVADGMELVPKVPPEKSFIDQSCKCVQPTSERRGTNNKQEF